ncbi:MAG: aspartate--tRNA ligase [Patescibacteria group bacterium]|nr:aspartate--tRNA ligase [Patescibacteria group bacterium]MDE1988094.1 aspartate--tRNA ligase [Patescibacteria group bacterium]MDE2218199.1 aspartate--tRNA ligase [Patescibacteria group bacterium]
MMKRTYIKDIKDKIGEEIKIAGWVDVRRDHGKLIFIDLRDMSGKIQTVALPNHKEARDAASKLRSEWVVEIVGKVNKRPEKMVNKDEVNGNVELEIMKVKILNEAVTPVFGINDDGREVNEETRLANRYLDLRRGRMQKNLRMRHEVMKFIRNYLSDNNFTEIETPLLTKSTPEGARDFVVPSRLYNGKFYALPQSPQQYKQLLMAGGMEKYFQIAKCLRDEDTRGDRQPEFTQLDLEMSFADQKDVMGLTEEMFIKAVKELYPQKKIQQIPFPIITYKEAMEKYDSDKPDLREDKNNPDLLAFCWVIDFPFFEKTEKGGWTFTHNPFSAPKPEYVEMLMRKEKIGEILTTQYDIALNGFEAGGGSVRNHKTEALQKVFEIMGFEKEKIWRDFGHMLRAFSSGAPPHGGIALGLDRVMMILQNEPNIREVIAFPKTGDARDPMMDSPSEISEEQIAELGIQIKKSANKSKI